MYDGLVKGEAKGLAKGLAESRTEGATEKTLEIARNLLDILDDATIASKTGLTEAEIARLR